jgi:hypothetical protein
MTARTRPEQLSARQPRSDTHTHAYLPRIPIRRETWTTAATSTAPSGCSSRTPHPCISLASLPRPATSALVHTGADRRPLLRPPRPHTAGVVQPHVGTASRAPHPAPPFSIIPPARLHTHRRVRVQHRLCPRLALIARTPDHLRPSLLVLARLAALVRHTRPAKHLVERELLHKLHPRVRRHLEPLHQLLPVPFIVQNLPHVSLAHTSPISYPLASRAVPPARQSARTPHRYTPGIARPAQT